MSTITETEPAAVLEVPSGFISADARAACRNVGKDVLEQNDFIKYIIGHIKGIKLGKKRSQKHRQISCVKRCQVCNTCTGATESAGVPANMKQ